MIELNDIAIKIQSVFNQNTLGKTFRIFSNVGELVKRNGHANEYRNGLLEYVSSTVSKLSGLEFVTASLNLTLFGNIDARDKDSDGNNIEIIELYQIINDFINEYNWQTFTEEYSEKTYSTTYVIGLPTNMPKASLGYINECLPITVSIGITYLENGVNSNQWKIYIDGEEIGYTEAVLSRVKTTEQNPRIVDRSTMASVQTNGFGLDIVMPQTTTRIMNKAEKEILKCDQDYAHMVYITGNDNQVAFICVFGNTQAKLVPNLNAGINISLLEGIPELLTYDDNFWIVDTITPEELTEKTITIDNPAGYFSGLDIVFWGDGNYTKIIDKDDVTQRTHTYAETGTYEIRRFIGDLDVYRLTLPSYVTIVRDGTILKNGAAIYSNDELTITFSPYYTVEVNGVECVSGDILTVDGNVEITGIINEYSLDIPEFVTVKRSDITLTESSVLYYGDELTITFSPYYAVTVNGNEIDSGDIIMVTGNISIVRTVKEYTLVYTKSDLYESVLIKKHNLIVPSGTTIKYGDTISMYGTSGYYDKRIKINGVTVTSSCGQEISYEYVAIGDTSIEMINTEGIC